jgi:hypothetical protein
VSFDSESKSLQNEEDTTGEDSLSVEEVTYELELADVSLINAHEYLFVILKLYNLTFKAMQK